MQPVSDHAIAAHTLRALTQRLDQLTATRVRVWLALLRHLGDARPFAEERFPVRVIKVWQIADELHSSRDQVSHALDWLVAEGIVREHSRDALGRRSLSLLLT
jgi:DNA-binding MarR family transcriptional regulator